MVIKEASTGETLSPRKMSTFRLNSNRWKDTVQPPQFLAVQPQVWGTPHISSLSKGLSFHLQSLLTFYHKHSSPFYTRNDPLLLLHLFSFFESWRKCGWTLCSKTSRSNWTSPLSTFSNISVHSIWTSMTTTGFFVSLDWNSFMTTKIEKKEEVSWWLCTRNPLLEKILKACGKQIKTLIYNVFADYRSIVDCHNIIARWGSI